mmetsp:Transcript_2085/g.13451  ORF Transcript_2085/g.13451 Transcript_2085/m.13451 type:complete len:1075 (-) Transcript_2085:750-3974(-)
MASLSRELVFLILQFLDEEKFRGTLHRLEQESGFRFNMQHFEDLVNQGKWDDVERYLSGFTTLEDNRYSMKIYFEIRKQKYLEALELQEKTTALDILTKDLKVFQALNSELYEEMTGLLVLDNFRENEKLAHYGDARTARALMFLELKKLIESNPVFLDKLEFPKMHPSRLRTVVNQALNWQHKLCKRPKPVPEINTLFVDHSCDNDFPRPNPVSAIAPHATGASGQITLPILQGQQNHVVYSQNLPMSHSSYQGQPLTTSLGLQSAPQFLNLPQGPVLMPMQMSHMAQPPSLQAMQQQEQQKRVREAAFVGSGPAQIPSQALQRPAKVRKQKDVHIFGTPRKSYATEDLPTSVILTLRFTSQPTTISFHPSNVNYLLAGDVAGCVSMFDTSTTLRLWSQNMSALVENVSVNKAVWSPDGSLIGAAMSSGRVALQAVHTNSVAVLGKPVEVSAHEGQVNDLKFTTLSSEQLVVVTCGDDKLVKVWDVRSGQMLYTFEGHEDRVFCVCPHIKNSISFLLSASRDGTIKVWLYGSTNSQVDFKVDGSYCTCITYSHDGSKLFSCGRGDGSTTTLFEWDEQHGTIKQRYTNFLNSTNDRAVIDTVANRFIVTVDEHKLKFWDFNEPRMLFSVTLEEELPPSSQVCFNCNGSLLAVLGQSKFVKVLASSKDAAHLMASRKSDGREEPEHVVSVEERPLEPVQDAPPASKEVVTEIARPPKEHSFEASSSQITDRASCTSRLLTDGDGHGIRYLVYSNNGTGLLALGSNATHSFWKWEKDGSRVFDEAALWKPSPSAVMQNDRSPGSDDAVACMVISRNDSYVLSASGGKVSLFNLLTFKIMAAFMPPPPAASCMAFHLEDNNIIAIGRDDGSLLIYNVRLDDVKVQVKEHDCMITGLAYSTKHECLVSVSSDAKVCVWDIVDDKYSKKDELKLQSEEAPTETETKLTRVSCMFTASHDHLLIAQPTRLDMVSVPALESSASWTPRDSLQSTITSACLSCDSRQIFCGFRDGSMAIFNVGNLAISCVFHPNVLGEGLYCTAIASHSDSAHGSQFAAGLSNGHVLILEPRLGGMLLWSEA